MNAYLFIVLGAIGLWWLNKRSIPREKIGGDSYDWNKESEILRAIHNIKFAYKRVASLPDALIMGVIRTESNLDPDARGALDEIGFMQVRPATYKWMVDTYAIFERPGGIYNPYNNLNAGMHYLDRQIKKTGSIEGGIHAYNLGFGGWRSGKRNAVYASRVIGFYNKYRYNYA